MSLRAVTLLAAAVTLFGGVAWAQLGRGGNAGIAAHMARPDSFDGRFHYCRAQYRMNPSGDGGNWLTDYPLADIDLSIRIAELTTTRVGFDAAGQPQHLIVRLTGDELFQCPFIMMQEVGRLFFDDEDAARLRTYLVKGGFLWVDDFWSSFAWDVWASQIRKVLPPGEFPIVDVPPDHPILHTMFNLDAVPQIPSINFWYGSRGGTSERYGDSAQVHARAISDAKGRIMVFMTHNTDVSDSWEREGEDPQYFLKFSVVGYQVALNVLIYTMTH
ncbi:MAG: DUF4159 domain-containing protein [Acidobacteria bacterium]|nr:DUF4159 domain-containing protein [Acidobacteriota bacterium]